MHASGRQNLEVLHSVCSNPTAGCARDAAPVGAVGMPAVTKQKKKKWRGTMLVLCYELLRHA